MDGIKIFSATKARDRAKLGDEATTWLNEQKKLSPCFTVVDKIVTQSSDNEFHCLSITLFYKKVDDTSTRRGPRR